MTRLPQFDFTGPEPPHLREELKAYGRALKNSMPKGWGFTLLMFTYGAGGSMMYLSSAQRGPMIESLKELIAKLETGEATAREGT